jgi:hypothetical protein
MDADRSRAPGDDDLVWYVAYGSNLSSARVRHYLEGGRPPGARRGQVGARDPRPPRAARPVWLDGSVYFARESATWGGGVAFHDPDAPGRSAGRAYLLTVGQFSDLAHQESQQEPGRDLELDEVLARGRGTVSAGWYGTVVVVGEMAGIPMVTVTAAAVPGPAQLRAPSEAYLGTIVDGLLEAHRWPRAAVARYLVACPGMAGVWDPARVEALALRREQTGRRTGPPG